MSIAFYSQDIPLRLVLTECDFRNNWFVMSYLILLILVPCLEFIINSKGSCEFRISNREIKMNSLEIATLTMLIVCVIVGWIGGQFNKNGYNVVNFIMLYFIGRWLNVHFDWIKHHSKWIYLAVYIICQLLLSAQFLLLYGYLGKVSNINSTMHTMGYNNPLLLSGSVCLFLFFSKLQIHYKVINFFAVGVFGVYIISCISWLHTLWSDVASDIFNAYSYIGLLCLDSLYFMTLLSISLLINNLVILPINNKLKVIWKEKFSNNIKWT